jgi:hypothetical protein
VNGNGCVECGGMEGECAGRYWKGFYGDETVVFTVRVYGMLWTGDYGEDRREGKREGDRKGQGTDYGGFKKDGEVRG